jgi:hypothetical protein
VSGARMAAQRGGEDTMFLGETRLQIVEKTAVGGPAVHQKNGRSHAVIGVGHSGPIWQNAHRQTGIPLFGPVLGPIFSLCCPALYRRLET